MGREYNDSNVNKQTMNKRKQRGVRKVLHGASFEVFELVLGAMPAFVRDFSAFIKGLAWVILENFKFLRDAQVAFPCATPVWACFLLNLPHDVDIFVFHFLFPDILR